MQNYFVIHSKRTIFTLPQEQHPPAKLGIWINRRMGNNKYFYNNKTLQFEKADKTLKQRFFKGLSITSAILVSFVAFYFAVSAFYESPREKNLQGEVEQMTLVFEDMSHQVDEMSKVLENIQDRDASIHRVMFGMNPIDASVWNGGTGGHDKYKNYEQFDYNGEQLKAIKQKADQLTVKLAVQSVSLDTLETLALNREDMLSSIPSIKPVRVDKLKRKMELLSGFGYRIHPIDKVRKMHYGIDFTAPKGTPIHATGKGKVIKVKKSRSGFGHHVVIDHGFGYETLYAHMKDIDVKEGQEVIKGEVIGTVGSTGRSTAPHCHYEVHLNGTQINPIYFCHDGLTPEEYEELVRKASVTNQSLD